MMASLGLPFLKLVFLAIALAPLLVVIYRARGRSRVDVAVFAGLVGIWVWAYRHFVFGQEYVFHDTLWDHHSPYAILVQWLESGFPVGWNPFLNGGEPLYLFSNLFLWAELLAFSLLNRLFALPVHDLINLYFSYILISFSGFCLLLFTAIFRRRVTAFYALVPVLLGGLTISTFGQYMLSPLYLTPLALLSAYLFVRDRTLRYLAWAAFFVAVSANHYLPQYLVLVLAAFFVSAGMVRMASRIGRRSSGAPAVARRWAPARIGELALIVVLTGAALAPAVFVHREVRELVSPTRGGVRIAESGIGHQPPFRMKISQFGSLLRVPYVEPGLADPENLLYHHGPFYVGWLPVALAAFSLLLVRDRAYLPFLLTLGLLVIVALGQPVGLWASLRDRVPLLYIRHTYPLALPVTLLVVVLSGFGFERLPLSTRGQVLAVVLTLVVCVHGTQGRRHADARWERPFDLVAFTYPLERWPYSRRLTEVPIDTEPVITKRAVATHPDEDFVLFRRPPYQELVHRDLRLATGSLFGFSDGETGPPVPIDPPGDVEDRFGAAPAAGPVAVGRPAAGAAGAGAVRNPVMAWRLNGARTTITLDRAGIGVLLFRRSDPAELRGRLVGLSACVESPSAPLGVKLSSHEPTTGSAVTLLPARVPVDDAPRFSALDTYRTPGRWGCLRTNFYVRADAPSLIVTVAVWTERPSVVHLDRVQLWVLPDGRADGSATLRGMTVDAPSPDEIRVRAEFPRSGFLVRKENYHPGWSARVDGAPVAIRRWGQTFQAVPVSGGAHTVEFRFQSPYSVLMWVHFAAVLAGYALFALGLPGGSGRPGSRQEAVRP